MSLFGIDLEDGRELEITYEVCYPEEEWEGSLPYVEVIEVHLIEDGKHSDVMSNLKPLGTSLEDIEHEISSQLW